MIHVKQYKRQGVCKKTQTVRLYRTDQRIHDVNLSQLGSLVLHTIHTPSIPPGRIPTANSLGVPSQVVTHHELLMDVI